MCVVSILCLVTFVTLVLFTNASRDLVQWGVNSGFLLNILFMGFVLAEGVAQYRCIRKKGIPFQFIFMRLGILFLIAY